MTNNSPCNRGKPPVSHTFWEFAPIEIYFVDILKLIESKPDLG
jgi:hypothetical protein